jgi:hypothetical protein
MLCHPTMRPYRVLALLTASSLLALAGCADDSSPRPPAADAAIDTGADASPPVGDFTRFRRSFGGGPCPDDLDCSGYIDLRQDGRLLVDRMDEVPVVVHEATVSQSDLDEAIAVLTDPALVALLDLGEPPCEPPTDVFDSMLLVEDGDRHTNSVTLCDDDPIVAARAALDDIADAYLP